MQQRANYRAKLSYFAVTRTFVQHKKKQQKQTKYKHLHLIKQKLPKQIIITYYLNRLQKCLRHTVFYSIQIKINFLLHVSQLALQFIVRHWRDVCTSKVYWEESFQRTLCVNLLTPHRQILIMQHSWAV